MGNPEWTGNRNLLGIVTGLLETLSPVKLALVRVLTILFSD